MPPSVFFVRRGGNGVILSGASAESKNPYMLSLADSQWGAFWGTGPSTRRFAAAQDDRGGTVVRGKMGRVLRRASLAQDDGGWTKVQEDWRKCH